ncbi:MAG TPA: CGNR zinc finger domain-containing protein [Nocardioides sp.]
MRFDSHVLRLLGATVALVNATTEGYDGGRPVGVLSGSTLRDAIASALAAPAPGAESRPRISAADAVALAGLADDVHQVFAATDAGDVDAAATRVNALLLATGARPQLDHTPGQGWNLHFHAPDDTLARGWSAGIAAGLALALGSDLAGRLGVCAADGCDRVYVDTSKNGRRRFCSTRCQNRVKAAAHRDRRPPM